ncbi:MAG: aminoacyl-tRNA hydrolase [Oscillospiraceae bacterium]|nr:aminoacyl-tRNA hydrolase [Oscillospiraceae bacterium]
MILKPPGYILAGLGNPGPRYDGTRHNMGFAVIDALSAKYNIKVKKLRFQSLYGEGNIGGRRIILLKPQTFMNLSGRAVRACLDYYRLTPDRLAVIYDDAALPAGKVRVRPGGSDGGHNGMKDIIYQLNSDMFPRIRLGIGAPPHAGYDMADWVLSGFSPDEKPAMAAAVDKAVSAAEMITGGLSIACVMQSINGNP